ncbi:MAG: DUF2851 family protein [Calditrichaeota bacterium]|nr:DUF2851 family protein [Calditrichota bacterium]
MLVHDTSKIAESFLYHIWDGGHLKQENLRTTDGKPIEIISKGKWNVDAGPDFREVILKIDGQLQRGDVEIHTQEADWFTHKHQIDPKYEQVILHAVLWESKTAKPARTKSGRIIPTLILGNFLDESLERLQVTIEGELFGTKRIPNVCLLGQRKKAEIAVALDKWGLERLRIKKDRFKEELNYFNYDQLIYQGIMEALGYSKNQRQFLKLSLKMPVEIIWEIVRTYAAEKQELVAQSLLFGAAGFLREDRMSSSDYVRKLQKMWQRLSQTFDFEPLAAHEWQFFRLRPTNFPTLRIAAMAHLVVAFHDRGFHARLLDVFLNKKASPGKLARDIRKLLVVEARGYWQTHYQLAGEETAHPQFHLKHLIGNGRANEIVVNVIFPLLLAFAEETGDSELAMRIRETYLHSPKLQENKILRQMKEQILSLDKEKVAVVVSAARQQGLIHIFKHFCRSWRCSECIKAVAREINREGSEI